MLAALKPPTSRSSDRELRGKARSTKHGDDPFDSPRRPSRVASREQAPPKSKELVALEQEWEEGDGVEDGPLLSQADDGLNEGEDLDQPRGSVCEAHEHVDDDDDDFEIE